MQFGPVLMFELKYWMVEISHLLYSKLDEKMLCFGFFKRLLQWGNGFKVTLTDKAYLDGASVAREIFYRFVKVRKSLVESKFYPP